MAINTTNTATSALTTATASVNNPNAKLGKNDFMKLLLTELQYQDPTKPTDTAKILTQTSQLASLESANNTSDALKKLSASLGNAQQFSTIAAIGKTAYLGSDSIAHDKGTESTFEVYFPKAVKHGTVSITDGNGSVVKTLDVSTKPAGVYQFKWNGTDNLGEKAAAGVYHVNAEYTDANGNVQKTRLGAYPIEAVRFDNGNTLVKVGSNYVPLKNVKEVY